MPALVNYFSNTRLLWRQRDGAWEVDRLPVESHCHQRCIRHGLDHLRGMCTRKILWQIFHPHLAPRKMNEITFVKHEKKTKVCPHTSSLIPLLVSQAYSYWPVSGPITLSKRSTVALPSSCWRLRPTTDNRTINCGFKIQISVLELVLINFLYILINHPPIYTSFYLCNVFPPRQITDD